MYSAQNGPWQTTAPTKQQALDALIADMHKALGALAYAVWHKTTTKRLTD